MRITDQAELGALNSFGVRARARRLIRIEHEEDWGPALEHAAADPSRLLLGAGSNVLIAGDLEATVLQVATQGMHIVAEPATGESGVLVEAAAGVAWDDLVRWSLSQGLQGLENLAMIPGTVGAAPVQNIGAYGVELCELFDSLDALDLESGRARRFDRAECAFGYRESVFKTAGSDRWAITRVRLRLRREGPLHLDYADLRAELSGIAAPTARDLEAAVRRIRTRKLPDPRILGNAGSFFKNPVVDAVRAQELARRWPAMPQHASATGTKLPAAWLIEQCGWKGFREGDAGVHAAHALVLVNHGQATGAQLLALARRIRVSVHERFGLFLDPEPRILGASDSP